MPYEIETKDGIVIRNIPDNIPPDHQSIKDRVTKARGGAAPVAPETAQPTKASLSIGEQLKENVSRIPAMLKSGFGIPEQAQESIKKAQTSDLVAGHPITKAFTGPGKTLIGEPLRGGLWVGEKINEAFGAKPNSDARRWLDEQLKSYDQAKERGQAAWEGLPEGEKPLDLVTPATEIASVLSPSRQASNLASLPAKIADKIPRINKYLQGAVGGGVGSFMLPTSGDTENFGSEKLLKTGVGAGLGAGFPAAFDIVKAVGKVPADILMPWLAPTATKGKAYLKAAGDNSVRIADELMKYKPTIPGAELGAGQVAARTGNTALPAMQKQAERILPQPHAEAADKRNISRIAFGEGTKPGQAADLEAARKAASGVNYPKAFESGIPGFGQGKEFKTIYENPYVQKALPTARELSEASGAIVNGKIVKPVEFLHNVKIGLDKQLEKTGESALVAGEKTAVGKIRTALIKYLTNKSTEYGGARATHEAMSKPLNQAQTVDYLIGVMKQGFQPGAGGVPLNVKGFTESLRKSTDVGGDVASKRAAELIVKRGTGQPRYPELKEYMTLEQMRRLNLLRKDLSGEQAYEGLAKAGWQDAPQLRGVASEAMESGAKGFFPPLISHKVSIANAILRRSESGLNKALSEQMAKEMLIPKKVGKAILDAMTRKQKIEALNQFIEKSTLPAAIGATQQVNE